MSGSHVASLAVQALKAPSASTYPPSVVLHTRNMADIIDHKTGTPAPKVQEASKKVEIDDEISKCK